MENVCRHEILCDDKPLIIGYTKKKCTLPRGPHREETTLMTRCPLLCGRSVHMPMRNCLYGTVQKRCEVRHYVGTRQHTWRNY